MKTKTILSMLPLFIACACSGEHKTHAADNTSQNARDKEGHTLTPTDQSESDADRELTQRVRQSVVADDSLSVNAKNVKVITRNGKVTLRGVVDAQAEKDAVAAKARAVAGVLDVDNQLEVKTK